MSGGEPRLGRLRFHAAFEMVLDELVAVVAKEKQRDPENYRKSPQTRLLARIYRAIRQEIPGDPLHASYYQGRSEGHSYQQWKRAKPCDKYRLFFKYLKDGDLVVFTWITSDISAAKYRSHMDAHRAFRQELALERQPATGTGPVVEAQKVDIIL
ncbi:toxin YhaV [Geomonas limicola]|uniref:Toxin YhaV n=1 Tax=Geomonas limicola TaxID=2740186 RepID=A0A6V8NDR6_9BACT|nr:type II toxin-antitoxin system YhaV family toxin [Geomonas limicola]GFO69937.1 toxin YhaV [Geomonas limicola]